VSNAVGVRVRVRVRVREAGLGLEGAFTFTVVRRACHAWARSVSAFLLLSLVSIESNLTEKAAFFLKSYIDF
jgi:hypothetical protein